MAKKSILQNYLDSIRSENIKSLTAKSRNWFVDMLSGGELKGTVRKVIADPITKTKSRPTIGKMYMFIYDPKTKKTLPYYDRYPLIIMADKPAKGKGFYGLNLHYLRPIERAKLLQALEKSYSTTKGDMKENTRLRISYQILKSATKHRRFRPTFKRYLPNHIKSNIVEIPAPYWEVALFLPTQKFVGASSGKVWSDSRRLSR
jgi:hypothetical protein